MAREGRWGEMKQYKEGSGWDGKGERRENSLGPLAFPWPSLVSLSPLPTTFVRTRGTTCHQDKPLFVVTLTLKWLISGQFEHALAKFTIFYG